MKEIKIFISSTFCDMQVERDVLKNIVTPQLNAYFNKKGISISVIDLRWGINLEASEEDVETQILQVCMKEIDSCKPYFISFLGERYGWTPDYSLLEKSCNFMTDEDYDIVSQRNISVTEMEILYGAFSKHACLDNCFFCFRDKSSYDGLAKEQYNLYFENNIRQKTLKEKIINKCNTRQQGHIINYNAKLSENYIEQFNHLSEFGETLTKQIIETIENNLEISPPNNPDLLELEKFINTHSRFYVSRQSEEKLISDFIDLGNIKKITIYGESGTGKSFLLSEMYKHLKTKSNIIPLLYSTTFKQERSSYEDIIKCFCWQMKNIIIEEPGSEEHIDINIFECLLSQIKEAGYKIIFMIDAIERLSNDGITTSMSFIPKDEILLTTITKEEYDLRKKITDLGQSIKLSHFSEKEAIELLYNITNSSRFNLSDKYLDIIIKKQNKKSFAYESPLWVTLVAHTINTLNYFDFFAVNYDFKSNDNKTYGLYADFLNSLDGEKITCNEYLEDLLTYLPSDYKTLLDFVIDKAFSFFGKERYSFYMSLMLMSRKSLSIDIIERMYQKDLNPIRYSQIKNWTNSIFHNVEYETGSIYLHKKTREHLEQKFENSILLYRKMFIEKFKSDFENFDYSFLLDFYCDKKSKEYSLFHELIYQIVCLEDGGELRKLCNDVYFTDEVQSIIKSHLLQKNNSHNSNAPLWFRMINSIDKSDLEKAIIKLVDIRLYLNESKNIDDVDFHEYLWTFCYDIGLDLLRNEHYEVAYPLLFILSNVLETLKHFEELTVENLSELGMQSFHNMLVICYGNLSIIHNQRAEFQYALDFLEKRRTAYLDYANIICSKEEITYNEGKYFHMKGQIMKTLNNGINGRIFEIYKKADTLLDSVVYDFDVVDVIIDTKRSIAQYYLKKNDLANANNIYREALKIGRYGIEKSDNCYSNYHNYFSCLLEVFDFVSNHSEFKEFFEVDFDFSYSKIKNIYPEKYCDKEFYVFYTRIIKFFDNENQTDDLSKILNEADAAFKNKRKNLAINLLKEAEDYCIAQYKNNPNSYIKYQIGELYYKLGYIYQSKSDKTTNIPISNEYLEKSTVYGNINAYYLLARNSIALNDKDATLNYLKKGAEIHSVPCLRDYGMYLLEHKDNKGVELLEEAIIEDDYLSKLYKAVLLFNGDYGIDQNRDFAIEILSECYRNTYDDDIKELLNRAVFYARENFECGLDYKLPHIWYIVEKIDDTL